MWKSKDWIYVEQIRHKLEFLSIFMQYGTCEVKEHLPGFEPGMFSK